MSPAHGKSNKSFLSTTVVEYYYAYGTGLWGGYSIMGQVVTLEGDTFFFFFFT